LTAPEQSAAIQTENLDKKAASSTAKKKK